MNNEGGFFYAVGASILAMFGIGYALSKEKQIDKLAKSVGMSAKNLVDADRLDIRDSMISKAVNDAVSRETRSRFDQFSNDILYRAETSLKSNVANLVSKEVENAKKSVADQIINKIRSIDITDVVDDIKDNVKDELTSRIEDRLDDVAADIVNDYDKRVVIIRK